MLAANIGRLRPSLLLFHYRIDSEQVLFKEGAGRLHIARSDGPASRSNERSTGQDR